MKQKHTLTEDEHITLCEVGDAFWHALGKLTAEHLAKMPENLQDITLAYLQDKASLYGSNFSKYIEEARKCVRVQ